MNRDLLKKTTFSNTVETSTLHDLTFNISSLAKNNLGGSLLRYSRIMEWVFFSKFLQMFLLFFRQTRKETLILPSFTHVVDTRVPSCFFVAGYPSTTLSLCPLEPPDGITHWQQNKPQDFNATKAQRSGGRLLNYRIVFNTSYLISFDTVRIYIKQYYNITFLSWSGTLCTSTTYRLGKDNQVP